MEKTEMEILAEQVKLKQMAAAEERRVKMEILTGLDTKRLIELIPGLEANYEKARREENNYDNLNCKWLSSRGGDSSEVRRFKADIYLTLPGKNKEEREAQLDRQRTGETDLSKALNMEADINFTAENMRINTEMARMKLSDILAVIALRKSQIEFLAH